MTQTTILKLYQYNSVTDSSKETAEFIDNMSANMGTVDEKLGPLFRQNFMSMKMATYAN